MSKPLIFFQMLLRDFSFESPQENILYDEVLLQLADKQSNGEILRFWESSKVFIVLGIIGKEKEDVWLEKAREDHVFILRRTSGGGTVVQGPGCLNYSLILSKDRHPHLADLRKSYEWISAQIIDALQDCGIQAVFRPISDIALNISEKKFSGNAQHRGKHYILHHGTILYNFDLDLISHYLQMPKDIPPYRQNRPHTDFVTNVQVYPQRFKEALGRVLGLKGALQPQTPSFQELSTLQKLLQTRSVIIDF